MSMSGGNDTIDFNFDDEPDNLDGDGDPNAHHAGDDPNNGAVAEDRGDDVTPGTGSEGNPPSGVAETGTDAEVIDPELLAELTGDEAGNRQVPYARFAELHAQNQKLMATLESVAGAFKGAAAPPTASPPAAPPFDVKAAIKERNTALLEGDMDKAADLDLAILDHATTHARDTAKAEALQEFTEAAQQNAVQSIITGAFHKYPFLNDANPEFSEEALDEVMMYRNHYIQKGNGLPQALQMAIEKVCPQYVDESGVTDAPAPTPAPAATATGNRQPAKVVRNAKADQQQPPALRQGGIANRETIDTTKLNLETMKDDDYDKLPADVKARLRGDVAA